MSSPPESRVTWEEAVLRLRELPSQCDLVHDAYYDDPLTACANRYWRSEEWKAVRGFLPSGSGVALDVGAGRGIASYALAKEGFAVTALEPDASAIVGAEAIRALARDSGLPIRVTQEFSESLPFADASFDLVFARAVLHHTRELAVACREFHRVLKPGGRLVAIREHVISRPEDLSAFLDKHPLHKYYGGENAFVLSHYEATIRAAGFQTLRTLAPFDNAINFAPYTHASLREALAARVAARLPGTGGVLSALLAPAPLWWLTRQVLNRVDQRPGRLYSFIAERG